MYDMMNRIWTAFSPPTPEKVEDAIKIGILGTAKVAPMAIITSSASHPEVIVQAVASRDRARAEAFAKKHGIPDVRDSYQALLDDPNIDAVFIPLPNGLHCEWAMRAVRAGKHVLLEKPSVDNQAEAERLFNMPELSEPNAPVVLEGFHSRFHPAFQKFMTFIDPPNVEHAYSDVMVSKWLVAPGNIEFNYTVGGGCMMHLGTYNFGFLRTIFGAEPEECLSIETDIYGDGIHDQCDTGYRAKFRFPNGGTADANATLHGPVWWKPSEARVTHRPVVVPDKALPDTQEKVRTRLVTMHGMMHAVLWHRIDVSDKYVVRNKADGQPLKTWTEASSHKAYSYREAGGQYANLPGEAWWMSFRWQLEQFVNRIKGRKTPYWVTGQDSINQMRMVDMAYEKSGLGIRPTTDYRGRKG